MRRFALLGLVVAAAGGLLATGRLEAEPPDTPQIGTARVAFNDLTIESAQYAAGIDLVASYSVRGNRLHTDHRDGVDPAHRGLWQLVVDTIPGRWRRTIRQFTVVDEEIAGTVAMVHQSGLDHERWLLSIDQADGGNEQLVRDTLVHELAHLVTLRPGEFTFNHRMSGECDGVHIAVGCAHRDSILARWAEAFWADPLSEPEDDPLVFVAPYATAGPHEDLAETFLHWSRDGLGDAPADSVLAAKLEFIERELGEVLG